LNSAVVTTGRVTRGRVTVPRRRVGLRSTRA